VRKLLPVFSFAVALLLLVVVSLPVFGAYINTLVVRIFNNGTEFFGELPLLVSVNNTQLYTFSYINASGLNTNLEEGFFARPYEVADSRLGIYAPSFALGQVRTYNYRLEYTPEQSGFPLIVGVGGNLTVSDNSTLELSNNFTVSVNGYIQTDAGGDKNLVEKPEAFIITISAAQSITASIGGDDTFTPDPNPEVTSVDGDVTRGGPGEAWNTIQGAATGVAAASNAGDIESGWGTAGGANTWGMLVRGFLLFDTSVIPDTATVISATVRVFGTTKQDERPWGDLTWNVYSSGPATNTTLVIADYNKVGTTPFATPITYAAYDDGGWNTFTLNAAGLAAIDVASITRFGTREATYDAPDIVPTWSASDVARIIFQSADGANAPELVVVFQEASVTAAGQVSGEHDVDVFANFTTLSISVDGVQYDQTSMVGLSVPDNANDWVFMENESVIYADSIQVYNDNTPSGAMGLQLWYEPNTMVLSSTVPDRAFGGLVNPGTINWGTNPAGFEVTIGAIIPFTSHVSSSAESAIPDIFKIPDNLLYYEDPDADVTGLPLYGVFSNAAISLGWSPQVGYGFIAMIIPSVVMAFAVAVATGSLMLGGLFGALMLGMAAGTGVIAPWLPVAIMVVMIFGIYVMKRT